MNSSVIVFPGSNCDRDIAVALEKLQFKILWFGIKILSLPKSDLIVFLVVFLMVIILDQAQLLENLIF